MFPHPIKDAINLTSREVLGIFFPEHTWHNIANVVAGNLVVITCTCEATLQITLRERLDSGYSLKAIYGGLLKAPQLR